MKSPPVEHAPFALETRFWAVVDRDGLTGLPSDMWAALEILVARAAAAPDLLAALKPFVGVRDQFPQTVKLINPKLDGLEPVSVTVTKAQFLAAIAAIAKASPAAAATGGGL